jgi:hypothetical protein
MHSAFDSHFYSHFGSWSFCIAKWWRNIDFRLSHIISLLRTFRTW